LPLLFPYLLIPRSDNGTWQPYANAGRKLKQAPRPVSSVTTLGIRVNLSIVRVPSVCPSKIVRGAGARHRIEVALVVNVCGVSHGSALRGIGMLILPENRFSGSIKCVISIRTRKEILAGRVEHDARLGRVVQVKKRGGGNPLI